MTRLDRFEPEMMLVEPGDPRDTTTPDAMAKTIGRILTTDWLRPSSNALLINWMVATGTGMGEAPPIPDRYNDIAIAWPPARAPVIISAYYESPVWSQTMRDEDMAVLAKVGEIASRWVLAL